MPKIYFCVRIITHILIFGAQHMPHPTSILPSDKLTREATLIALEQILEPLASLMIDSGITAYDACQLIREAVVRTAQRRVQTDTGRASKSRVAAITGLPRSEVSRLWSSRSPNDKPAKSMLRPAQRILSAWYNSPTYLSNTGEPEILPVFGSRRSFQRLVAANGAGIPIRAMLDELVSIGAVELLPNQRVKAKARVPIQKGFSIESIRSIGERASDFLITLIQNLTSETPLFEANTGSVDVDPNAIALIRREVTSRGSTFFGSIESLLKNSEGRPTNRIESQPPAHRVRVGVGVFYFEKKPSGSSRKNTQPIRRKNLRRTTVERKHKSTRKPTESGEL